MRAFVLVTAVAAGVGGALAASAGVANANPTQNYKCDAAACVSGTYHQCQVWCQSGACECTSL